ncbi:MAG TPA: hypothetical protein VHZ24_03150 [Pirellulales bacterium]|jgi:hypothetical protein|nr:hypothetical protein [Pirellulales bacterium]
MRRVFLVAIILLFAVTTPAAEPEYDRDLARWQEVPIPPDTDQGARTVWLYAAGYSKHEWRVFADHDHVGAQLVTEQPTKHDDHPKFDPKAEEFESASAFAAADDGWLVGFNHGEFGAALYWFDGDGERNYKVSDHQVVDFFRLSDGWYAIEGLAHGTTSEGSAIRIARPKGGERWQATEVTKLPYAPYAVSLRKDGTMLVTLSDAIVSVGEDRKVQTLLPDAPWSGLYPGSSVLTSDEQKLYIGMRQFVGEFDLRAKKLRLLTPSDKFLHKLPADQEQQLRKAYSG